MTGIPRKPGEAAATAPNSLTDKVWQFNLECEDQQHEPLAGDRRVAAFGRASQYALDVYPQFRREVVGTFIARPQESVEYTFSRMLRAFQKALISEEAQKAQEAQELPRYPEQFDEPNWMNWFHAFEWVLNHNELADQFTYDMWTRDLTSNVTERYKNLKLLTLLLPGIIPSEPRVLDVGCSQNKGLAKLLLNRPFAHTSLMREETPLGDQAPSEKVTHVVDEEATKFVNEALAANVRFGRSTGVDKVRPFDTSVEEWTEACTFLPSERLNVSLRTEYDFLGRQKVPGLEFMLADFSTTQWHERRHGNIRRHLFNFIFYSTVLYQANNETERKAMLENGDRLKHPQGIKVVLDNASVDENSASGLRFNPDYAEDYAYTTHIEDPAGSGEFLEVFRWKNGRCLELKAGKDLGRLAANEGVNSELLEIIANES